MDITNAQMNGAIDKKFEQKYNYLILLLSKVVALKSSVSVTIPIPPIAPLTVAGSATFTNGILTSYTEPS